MNGDDDPIQCVFSGQSLIEMPLQPRDEDAFGELLEWLKSGDVRFTNLEATIRDGRSCWPMKEPRQGHVDDPDTFDELVDMGFNLFSLANNHAWDAGIDGVLDTLEYLESRSILHAGTGRDLDAARAPAIMETGDRTVALIAMASGGLPKHAFASGEEAGCRPGVNPLRVRTSCQVTDDAFETLETMTRAYGGDVHDSGESLAFQDTRFVRGDGVELRREINAADRAANLQTVETAAEQADLVLVYLHQHHWEPDQLAVGDWLQEFARECIDAGAHAVLGHGVPLMQPIERYKDRPICYSLGNFIFHCSDPSYWSDPWCWQSVLLEGEFAGGKWTDLSARPISLAKPGLLTAGDFDRLRERHCPMAATGDQATSILERLRDLSKSFGTESHVDEDSRRLSISI